MVGFLFFVLFFLYVLKMARLRFAYFVHDGEFNCLVEKG